MHNGGYLLKILIGMLVSFLGLRLIKMPFFVSLNWRHSIVVEKLQSLFGFSENLHHFLDKTDSYWGSRIILSFFRV